jgi:hypothetical protein
VAAAHRDTWSLHPGRSEEARGLRPTLISSGTHRLDIHGEDGDPQPPQSHQRSTMLGGFECMIDQWISNCWFFSI